MQKGRSRCDLHPVARAENSVAVSRVTLAVVRRGRGGRRKFHPRVERVHRAHVLAGVAPLSIRVPPSPRSASLRSTPLFLLAGCAPRHLERRDLIFIRLISFVLFSPPTGATVITAAFPTENMNFHFNFRLTVPSPRQPLSRKFIF